MTDKKIPLVYIGGCGHSGSTLLNIIFDTHSEIVGTGELEYYNPNNIEEIKCSCSNKASECDLWGKVHEKLREYTEKEGLEVNDLLLHKTSYISLRKFWKIPDLGYYGHGGKLSAEEIKRFNRDNALLMRAILEVTDKRIILDSSKPPARLFYLSQSDLFDLKVIYIIRNGMALINSYRGRENMPNIPNFKSALYWTVHNYRMQRCIKKVLKSEQVTRLYYEKFAASPEEEIKRLCDFIGVEFEEEMLNYIEKPHHILAGNPIRMNPNKKIKPDDSWKKKLSWWDKTVFKLIGGPMNKYLGY